jgi:hypothetical protein
MQNYFRYSETVAIAPPTAPPSSTIIASEVLSGVCILTVPLLLVLGILGYRKHRVRILQLQIARLEKALQLTPNETL